MSDTLWFLVVFKNKKQSNYIHLLVEAGGVEPPSESIPR